MLTSDAQAFIRGQIRVMEARLRKAESRIEKSEGENKVECERAKKLTKLLELHRKDPEAALELYK